MKRNANSWDSFQERVFLENQLDRRIQFYLVFIVISIAVSLLIPSKEIAIMFLILFVIVSWLLVTSIFFTSSKLKNVEKELGKEFSVKEKLIRSSYTLLLPILSSLLLTFFLLLVVSGSIDSILPYKQKLVDSTKEMINKVENTVDKKLKPNNDASRYFKTVDSVFSDSRNNYVIVDSSLIKVKEENKNLKKPVKPKPKTDPNFKSIDKIIND
ncbi:hypothetical protein [Stygiobacter electus]|uniref:Uncharacterized protein n=1 Tax=Stygiobacter electus TaxID=3032292 RepID=A0AAE3P4Q4_9BACT|nr:hypothetical protein [Stygiobacter electus]MDF1612955.1 hypothetical protein [Stygiobacter electus]